MKNKKYLIAVLVLLLVGCLGYFLCTKLLEGEKDLKNVVYRIVNKKELGLTKIDEWVLVEKFGFDENNDTYEITSSDNIIASISESLVSQMNGNIFIEGYYSNNNFYTSIIEGGKIVIKRANVNSQTYSDYINVPMPSGYTCNGSTCLANIVAITDNNIYFHAATLDGEYVNNIYVLNLSDKTVTKLNSSYTWGTHRNLKTYNYKDYVIIEVDAGLFLIDNDNFETIINIDKDTYGTLGSLSTKNNELYFSVDGKDYNVENPPKETNTEYKYNFESKKLIELNK